MGWKDWKMLKGGNAFLRYLSMFFHPSLVLLSLMQQIFRCDPDVNPGTTRDRVNGGNRFRKLLGHKQNKTSWRRKGVIPSS